MKKVAITGHTRGIGKALWDYYEGCTRLGFSKTEGWDLDNKQICDAVVHNIKDYDIFINNAPNENQTYLFEQIHKMWYGQDKIIINLSSNVGDTSLNIMERVEQRVGEQLIGPFKKYVGMKSKLDKLSTDIVMDSHVTGEYKPWVINIKPYAIDTDYIRNPHLPKYLSEDKVMSVDDFMEVYDCLIKLQNKVQITNITFTGVTDVRR